MPFVTEQDDLQQLNQYPTAIQTFADPVDLTGKVAEEVPEFRAGTPELSETFKAAFKQENLVVSAFNSSVDKDYEFDENYNPFDEDLTGYETYNSVLALAKNKQHFEDIKTQIDKERVDRDILERSGAWGFVAQIGAGLLDPTVLIPVGGVATKGFKGLKQAGKLAAVTSGTVAGQEVGLQATQEIRPMEESYTNVLASALLAGAFGAGAVAFRAKQGKVYNEWIKKTAQDLEAPTDTVRQVMQRNNFDVEKTIEDLGESVGAAKVSGVDIAKAVKEGREYALKQERLVGAFGFEKLLKRVTPMMRTLQSDFVQTRLLTQKLVNVPLTIEKNKLGEATEQSVEILRDLYQADYLNASNKINKLYSEYRKSNLSKGEKPLPVSRTTIAEITKEKLGKKANETSFLEEVGKALRRGDKHDIPEVEKAAKIYRSEIFDKLGKEAERSGVFKEMPDRKTAESYFTRIFNQEAIVADRDNFQNIVKDWLKETTAKKVGDIKESIARKQAKIQNEIDDLQINKFRKASFLQEQAENSDLSLDEVKSLLGALAAGKPRKPQSLLNYIQSEGGIYKDDFNINDIRIDDIKGFQKENPFKGKVLRDLEEGGLKLDEIGERAYQAGFYNERPDVATLIDDINDELAGRAKVRPNDEVALQDYKYFNELESVVDRVGINPKDYKGGKILTPEPELQKLRKNLIAATDEIAEREIKALKVKQQKLALKEQEQLDGIEEMGIDAYSEELAESITNNVIGLNQVSPEFNFDIAFKGPLKQQKFLIPDELVEDYIESNAMEVAERYTRNVGTDIELMHKFGATKFEDIVQPLNREYLEQEKLAKTAKEKKALKKKFDNDVRDLEGMYQVLRGTYAGDLYSQPDSLWKQIGRGAMAYNYVRMMGGVALASVPDVGKQVMYNGAFNFFKDGLAPLAKELPKILKGQSSELLKEAKLAGQTIEHIMNSRAMSYADLGSRYTTNTNFDNFMNVSSKLFTKATLMTDWNNVMQSVASVMSQKRILKNIQSDSITPKEKEFMASIGLGTQEIKKLKAQVNKYSKKDGEFILANSELWDDIDARKLFRGALKKDTESVVIEKNIGDIPLFANSAWGKVILQFKSFMFATMTKTFLPALQRADLAAINGISTMVALGALSYVAKEGIKGKDADLTPENLLVQGLDRSGILTVFMEANNIGEKLTGYGISQLAGQQPIARYASRSWHEALFGPSLGTLGNVGQAIRSSTADGELSESDKKNLIRLAPYSNLFYFRYLMNQTSDLQY